MVPFTFLLVLVCHWRHGLDAHGPENVFWPSLSPHLENSFLASSPEVVRRIRREVTRKMGNALNPFGQRDRNARAHWQFQRVVSLHFFHRAVRLSLDKIGLDRNYSAAISLDVPKTDAN
jgi:hypothetical protein